MLTDFLANYFFTLPVAFLLSSYLNMQKKDSFFVFNRLSKKELIKTFLIAILSFPFIEEVVFNLSADVLIEKLFFTNSKVFRTHFKPICFGLLHFTNLLVVYDLKLITLQVILATHFRYCIVLGGYEFYQSFWIHSFLNSIPFIIWTFYFSRMSRYLRNILFEGVLTTSLSVDEDGEGDEEDEEQSKKDLLDLFESPSIFLRERTCDDMFTYHIDYQKPAEEKCMALRDNKRIKKLWTSLKKRTNKLPMIIVRSSHPKVSKNEYKKIDKQQPMSN